MIASATQEDMNNRTIKITSVAAHMLTGTGFLTRLLLDHTIIDAVYFSRSENVTEKVQYVMYQQQPAIMCCVASYIYAILIAIDKAAPLLPIMDGVIFGLVLVTLAELNDFVQLFMATTAYLSYKLITPDLLAKKSGLSTKLAAAILVTMFWITYIMGSVINAPGGPSGIRVAQFFGSIVLVYDVVWFTGVAQKEALCWSDSTDRVMKLVMRFTLLVCGFTETV